MRHFVNLGYITSKNSIKANNKVKVNRGGEKLLKKPIQKSNKVN